MKDCVYIVRLGYMDFRFTNKVRALDFAREALLAYVKDGDNDRLRVNINLELEEAPEEPKDPEDMVDDLPFDNEGGDE